MVRDSTHRPRNTDELLSLAVEKDGQPSSLPAPRKDRFGNPRCDDSAVLSFLTASTDCGQEADDSDDGDTIVQLQGRHSTLLDDEIQSTIDELQRNSLTLREAREGSLCCDSIDDDMHNPALTSAFPSQGDTLAVSMTSASVSVDLPARRAPRLTASHTTTTAILLSRHFCFTGLPDAQRANLTGLVPYSHPYQHRSKPMIKIRFEDNIPSSTQ